MHSGMKTPLGRGSIPLSISATRAPAKDSVRQKRVITPIKSKRTDTDLEIFDIALPTLATLAADPVSALISTSFVGLGLGALSLAAVGISLSIFNTVTKMFNMPLLAVTTSNIASALGSAECSASSPRYSHVLGTAITASLLLALSTGFGEALLLTFLGDSALQIYGAGPVSPMHGEAATYLSSRTICIPITTCFLTLQGVFRGLGRTKIPFYATLGSNSIIIFLDWLLLTQYKTGVAGAAWSIGVAQTCACGGLLLLLQREGLIQPLDKKTIYASSLKSSLKATGFLTVRTIFISSTFALATGLASRVGGSDVAAAHQVAFQVWLASSLLADSLAVAAQSLIARDLASGRDAEASLVAERTLKLSGALGVVLAGGLAMLSPFLPQLFSTDDMVVSITSSLMPILVVTQPINAMAFLMDGILYGVNGFAFAAQALAVATVPAALVMWLGTSTSSTPLFPIWSGLTLLMILRFATMYVPYKMKWKPFDVLNSRE